MENKTYLKICIVILCLGIIAFSYGFFLYSIDYGTKDYTEYNQVENMPCELKQLDDGYVQLPNCAVYKLSESYLEKLKRGIKING